MKKILKSKKDVPVLDYLAFILLLGFVTLYFRTALHYTESYTWFIIEACVTAFIFSMRFGYLYDVPGKKIKNYFSVLFIRFGSWKPVNAKITHVDLSGKVKYLGAEDAFGSYTNEDVIIRMKINLKLEKGSVTVFETRKRELLYERAIYIARTYHVKICDRTTNAIKWYDPSNVKEK